MYSVVPHSFMVEKGHKNRLVDRTNLKRMDTNRVTGLN